jgi:dihydroxycyclohexadiene carboxylate dehydrogenase
MASSVQVLDSKAAGARRFEGKTAIVSGAGQGHGRATARRLAQEGAALMLVDRHAAGAKRTRDELTQFGSDADTYVGDISSVEPFQEVAAKTVERFGKIDVLVNVAGGAMYGPKLGWEYTPDELMANVQNNLWTCMWGCYSVLPYMVEQGSGAIVNFGSHAVRGTHRLGYAAAKGGIYAVTTSLALETAQSGVRINCVVPHYSESEPGDRLVTRVPGQTAPKTTQAMQPGRADLQARHLQNIPMGRAGTPQELAAAVAFLASDDASFVTGDIMCVGGGAFCAL